MAERLPGLHDGVAAGGVARRTFACVVVVGLSLGRGVPAHARVDATDRHAASGVDDTRPTDALDAGSWLSALGGPSAARRLGEGTLRAWGLAIYDATLWVGPGFRAASWQQSAFALSLRYRRDFRGADIARRSLDEMQRMQPIDADVAARWLAAMERAFPDVRAGDRLTGVWLPSSGRTVFHGPRGVVDIDGEPGFGPRFFALWLSPQGPKPALRAALLGDARPS